MHAPRYQNEPTDPRKATLCPAVNWMEENQDIYIIITNRLAAAYHDAAGYLGF